MLIRGLDLVVPQAWISAFIITNIASFLFPVILHKTFGFRTALLAVLFPTYLVFTTIPYSDVISLVLLALSVLFILRERILVSSTSVSLAILNFYHLAWTLPAYACEVLRTKRVRVLAFAALPLVSGVLILVWFKITTGNFLTYFSIEKAVWGEGITSPWGQVKWILNGWFTSQPLDLLGLRLPPVYWLVRNILFQMFYLVGAFLILKTSSQHKGFLFLYALVAIVPLLFMTGTPAISVPRLLLPAFPVFYAYATVMKRREHYAVYAVLSFIVAAWVTISQTYSFFA